MINVESTTNQHLTVLKQQVTGVAILLDSAPRTWTSMEEINCRLSLRLTSLGIPVVLVYAATLPPEIDQRMRDAGAIIEVVPYGKERYRFYKDLGRIVKQYSISMAHVCFFDYFSFVPWIARVNGLRHIVYEELNSGMMTATSWKRKLLRLRTLIMSWPMSRVIAVSNFVKQDLIKRGIAAERIDVRYLAADQERFKPDPTAREQWASKYSIAPDEMIMSSVTLLRPFKSPETLVEASAILKQRGVKARLFMAGDGSMLNDLKALGKKLGVSHTIHWLGFSKDPTKLIQASDVFLLASVAEAGGFVLSEAMGCGTPIIGSRSGVISECVEEGKTGLLATPKDPASFADAIEKLATDERLRQSMRENSRARMLELFTTDINVENTLRIYASLFHKLTL
ncbi:MAG TPA: glycosyltransferase family 4 protein [Pyrinomonadaceae bacterium]|nr:glycosyltransferase family 4 protein [Pyrinomonadaceae bacterium]